MIPLESILSAPPPTLREPGEGRPQIQRVRYSHEAMLDTLLAEPKISQRELAARFDRTEAWISIVINSDVFQARLEERRQTEVLPHIAASVKTRLSAIASESLQRIHERLLDQAKPPKDEFLLASAKLATDAMGYGARPSGPSSPGHVSVVVNVPGQVASADEWARQHSPVPSDIVDNPS